MKSWEDREEILLQAARRGLEAPQAQRQRILRNVSLALGLAVQTTTASAAAAATTSLATKSAAVGTGSAWPGAVAGLTLKKTLLGGLILGSASAGAVYAVEMAHTPSTEPTASVPSATPVDTIAPSPRPASQQNGPATPSVPTAEQPAREEPVRRGPEIHRQDEDLPMGPNTVAGSALTEELMLVKRARSLMNQPDPAAALELLSELDTRFPSGALMQERSATRVLALCALGQHAQARAAAASFLSAHPDSVYAERVRRACTGVSVPTKDKNPTQQTDPSPQRHEVLESEEQPK